jgi:tetratricopeptide (TPR) repeat protein
MKPIRLLAALAVFASAPVSRAADVPLYELGPFSRPVTTSSAEAQRYFDQGLAFLYGFNHDEAIRAFQRAAELDPGCAMAHWGVALANGPHINNPVLPAERSEAGYAALARARAASAGASPVEKALIVALTARYVSPPPEDRRHLELAYANAMRAVWAAFPKDADVGALFAEALADLRPWDFWLPDGKPQPGTEELVATLEEVMKLDQKHPRLSRAVPTRPPTRCASGCPGSATWCTCPRTSTCGADAGPRRSPPTPRRWRPTAATRRALPSRASTACTWPTTTTCSPTRR